LGLGLKALSECIQIVRQNAPPVILKKLSVKTSKTHRKGYHWLSGFQIPEMQKAHLKGWALQNN
jgi:hypothetical protein